MNSLSVYEVNSLSELEMKETNGGAVPAIVVAAAAIGGAFVVGLAVGALAAWAVYELTH